MSAPARRSLRRKLALVLWGVALSSLALATLALAAYHHFTLEQRVRASLGPYADLVSVGADAAIAFEDPRRAQEILETLRANSSILGGRILLEDGRTLARFGASSAGPRAPAGVVLGDGRAELWRDLPHGAALDLVMSLDGLARERRDAIWLLSAAVLGLLAVTVGQLAVLQRTLVRPIAALHDAAEAVRSRGDYQQRVPASGDDEVARLGRTFNEMLQVVDERERALRELGTFQRAIVENAPYAIATTTPEGLVTSLNPAAERLVGFRADELLGQRLADRLRAPEEEPGGGPPRSPGAAADLAGLAARSREGESGALELTIERKDGTHVPIQLSLRALRDGAGSVTGYVGMAIDLTQQKVLGEQLRQAQKLEALGQLAGGIAHDFNNLLLVINSYADLVHEALPGDHPAAGDIDAIREAGMRAAGLTRQLLAFSRKQLLQPVVLDVNQTVSDMERLLRRVIGEDVEVRVALAADAGWTRADPVQLEQVLMNLVLNARDAMPRGGTLSIATARAVLDEAHAHLHPGTRAGGYVRLSVSDTGVGMDDATCARMFEPFFTTKGLGKGTGLGLSMVYGIVQQTGGYIDVRTAPRQGTTISVYLPQVEGPEKTADADREAGPGGTETILLVEDEDAVRALGERLLRRLGYKVLAARTAEEALRVAEGHGVPIDLLVSDVILPGLDGAELATRLTGARSVLRVLFVSGYTDDRLADRYPGTAWPHLLQKPFQAAELARRVRALLDEPADRGQAG